MRHEAEEADKAFGLTLPNSRVESKLKHSPEFHDVLDSDSGTPRSPPRFPMAHAGISPTGWHPGRVEGARLLQQVRLGQDTLAPAFIFHDLGKEQPPLSPEQNVRPADTFERRRRHAEHGADWTAPYYHAGEDAAALAHHHHTPLGELRDTFPAALIPMLHAMELADGLSELTRRLAAVGPVEPEATVLTARQSNRDARQHRRCRLAAQIPAPPALGGLAAPRLPSGPHR